jgi:hypothetical protein
MPLAAIDPSLAIGFYVGGPADLADLCGRLAEVAAAAGNAPLVTVDAGGVEGAESDGGGARARERERHEEGGGGGGGADDWEML